MTMEFASQVVWGLTAIAGIGLCLRAWLRGGRGWLSLVGIGAGGELLAITGLLGGTETQTVAEFGAMQVGAAVAVLGWTMYAVGLLEERLIDRPGADRRAIATAARVARGLLAAWPVAFVALLLTNGAHGLVASGFGDGFVDFGPAVAVNLAYIYIGILWAPVALFGGGVSLALSSAGTRRSVAVLVAAQVGFVTLFVALLRVVAVLPVTVAPLGLVVGGLLLTEAAAASHSRPNRGQVTA